MIRTRNLMSQTVPSGSNKQVSISTHGCVENPLSDGEVHGLQAGLELFMQNDHHRARKPHRAHSHGLTLSLHVVT